MSSAEIINYLTLFFGIIVFFTFNLFNFRFAKYFNLIDKPKKNKIHKNATPLTASYSIFFVFIIYHLLYLTFQNFNYDILLIFFSGIFGFSIGILDDKKNLGYNTKFLVFIIFILIIVNFSENLILNVIYFETFNKFFYLTNLEANLVTILCILLLINATNLCDGINGLCLGILTIWLFYINFKFFSDLDLSAIIILSIFSFVYIIRGFYFLGNSGSHFLGIFIGAVIIYTYNLKINNISQAEIISVEEIFILLMLPGIDMLRLFIIRILNKKNPFSSDLSHLHHYLIKRYNLIISLLVYFISIITPLVLYNFTNIEPFIIIIGFVFFYIFLINYLVKKTNNNIIDL